ncbi:MAG: hypothetical protein E7354_01495 [Clostridiales bacterium]|nr:hypothetical protein [Clostridiales bacterium]
MKKKRAIRNYVLTSIFVVLVFLLTFIPFPVPGTSYNFMGLANLHLGLELGGGVKNTYDIEIADWYEGTEEDAYRETVDRVQYLLDKQYSDAKAYINADKKITIEVPDTTISESFLIGFIEMKSESGEDAEAKVTGQDIESVEYMLSGTTHGVYIKFTEEGKEKFAELTKTVSSKDEQTMYIYMNKNYDQAFSEPTVTEENTMGYTFISGSGITNKSSGKAYADRLAGTMIGVNMTTKTEATEVVSENGNSVRIMMTIVTIAVVVAAVVVAYVLFKELGLVSSLSLFFALAVSVLVSAIFDLQITVAGWLGFVIGFVFNYVLHLYYLNVIKREYAKGKKFIVSFSSGYRGALFNMLDVLLLTTGSVLFLLFIPSNLVRMFVYNFLMTIPGTAFTSMFLNKVFAVNYTAFNLKNEKKVNFTKEANIDEN